MLDNYVVWKGASQIDGEPILLILTGIKNPSQNRKTGAMIQSYILKEGVLPTEYRKNGSYSICGNCPIKDACYVGNHYLNNIYDGSERDIEKLPLAMLRGKPLRLGAYGDPAAVPVKVWERLLRWATGGYTGYTHGWRWCDPKLSNYCLASVESEETMQEAWSKGWKTYRVGLPEETPTKNELYCPHYTSEPTIQCIQCQLCSGLGLDTKKGIFVHVHGRQDKKKAFKKYKEQQNGS